jgi:hypothetical protein
MSILILLLGFLLIATEKVSAEPRCGGCHAQVTAQHAGRDIGCVACHGGDAGAVSASEGHAGLIASPGRFGGGEAGCAGCHAREVAAVKAGVMHTGAGMVRVTRAVLGEAADSVPTLQTLGDGVADSLLRKLCASCHLGQPGRSDGDPLTHRGAGCLACHVGKDDAGPHPRVSARVTDAHCVGCHSRSGRISLNYAGLAEVDPPLLDAAWQGLSRLADGRLVEHRAADVHHAAGLSCVDCHTGPGLMGLVGGIDIACTDCHATDQPTSPAQRRDDAPGERSREAVLQTAHGTPLTHVVKNGEQVLLYPKGGGEALAVPQAPAGHYAEAAAHEHLTCDACHATWAPQCHGCHVAFDPAQPQWDHAAGKTTAGRWTERRWGIRNTLPPLGVDAAGQVRTVVPGMIMTLEHPDLTAPLFVRRFAALSPHTTGPARRCAECHGAPTALGFGAGRLTHAEGDAAGFEPLMSLLDDGLPADAWVSPDGDVEPAPHDRVRPFSAKTLRKLMKPLGNRVDSDGSTF